MALTAEDRALMIKKLLNKAEAKGTTPEEREALSVKATQLMMQWGIEEALVHDADRAQVENIIKRDFRPDCPKSYSYEFTVVGIEIAEAFGCRGYLLKTSRTGLIALTIVGFESDVERAIEMYKSLAVQCTLNLATAFRRWTVSQLYTPTGTDKFNWKRSFIRGFAYGIRDKFAAIKTVVVKESAPGTELVLVDRTAKVDSYIEDNMKLGKPGRGRDYGAEGAMSGHQAGLRADIGQTATGSSRKGVGR